MKSTELALIAHKQHKNIVRDVAKMELAWVEIGGLKFELTSYTTSQGKEHKEYLLTPDQVLFIMSKYDDKVRAQLILRLRALEDENKKLMQSENERLWDKLDRQDLY